MTDELREKAKAFGEKHRQQGTDGWQLMADFAAECVRAERERVAEFMSSLSDRVDVQHGTLVRRPNGRWRALSSLNYQHIRGVFGSPVEALEALKAYNAERKKAK